MELFALWYTHSPEGRRVVEGWEQRALLAAAGVLAAYVLLRLRSSRPESVRAGSARTVVLRFAAAGIVAAGLWLAVDLVRGEDFLGALWAALPPHENAVKGLLLVGCGWAGWSIALSELFRRLARSWQQRLTEPSASAGGRRC
jgi:hypothetical protein